MYRHYRARPHPPLETREPPPRRVTKDYVVFLRGIGASKELVEFAERKVKESESESDASERQAASDS